MAEKAGFCFGVKRAIKMALEGAEKYGEVCSLGPLIHNPQEVSRLANNGVYWSDRMEDIRCKTVIIRSHGVPPVALHQLKEMGYNTIDATCPFVKRAQNIAEELQDSGCQVVIVGDKNHLRSKGFWGIWETMQSSSVPRRSENDGSWGAGWDTRTNDTDFGGFFAYCG